MSEELNQATTIEQPADSLPLDSANGLEVESPILSPELNSELLINNDVNPVSYIGQLHAFIETGGPVVIILFAMSVIGLAVLLLKLWQFFNVSLSRTQFVTSALDAWRQQNLAEMNRILQKSKNPIARVIEHATTVCADKNIDQTTAREEVLRVASLQLANVRSYLRVIEVIAALSPLLGLFGTVLGMIEAFQQLEQAGAKVDPAILSGGIWEALLTTAVGLAVAIPAIIALNWLEQKIDNFKLTMEDAMTQVFTSNISASK